MNFYKQKYEKYKLKYLQLKQYGGVGPEKRKGDDDQERSAKIIKKDQQRLSSLIPYLKSLERPQHIQPQLSERPQHIQPPEPLVDPFSNLLSSYNINNNYVDDFIRKLSDLNDRLTDLTHPEYLAQPLNTYHITLEFETKKILMEPYGEYAYCINDGQQKIIIFYKLTYVKDEHDEIISIIPYYISDGLTNQFRGGMLFPFMCKSNNTITSNCPTSENFPNALLKYAISDNIQMDIFNKWIYQSLYNYIGKSNVVLYIDTINKIKIHMNYIFNNLSDRDDITSVLSRIKNMLDFIISVFSDRFFIFSDSTILEKKFIDPNDFNKYIETFAPINGDNSYNYKITNVIKSEFDNNFRHEIRKLLYQLFYDMADHIANSGLVNIQQKKLKIKNIEITEFNNLINICKDARINENANNNYNNYYLISFITQQIIWAKCDSLINYFQTELVNPNNLNKKYLENNLQFLRSFIVIKKSNIPNITNFDMFIRNWKAKC